MWSKRCRRRSRLTCGQHLSRVWLPQTLAGAAAGALKSALRCRSTITGRLRPASRTVRCALEMSFQPEQYRIACRKRLSPLLCGLACFSGFRRQLFAPVIRLPARSAHFSGRLFLPPHYTKVRARQDPAKAPHRGVAAMPMELLSGARFPPAPIRRLSIWDRERPVRPDPHGHKAP